MSFFDLTILELAKKVKDSSSEAAKEIEKNLARINVLYKELESENE